MGKIEQTVMDLATPIAAAHGLRIYAVEYKKEGGDYCLRVFLYRDGGVTIDDCETVSRALSDALDAADPIREPYCLEVSSPGIERLLTEDWHFETAIGEPVEIKLYAPMDGKKKITGILKDYRDGQITIDCENVTVHIEGKQAAHVRTIFS